ncbi:transmembrane protein 183 [Trichuris trichiura]|uniref:Transmembrane protein 183 n=1 Tax=Trichuris trichiura TaxID=36087 RepID=A0A077YXR1_TRITR|nr:transmembrane protein 183 [Trichuris trichiura]
MVALYFLNATCSVWSIIILSVVQSAESHRSYPPDLWHLVAQFIRPEDVCTFALLCRDTAAVVRSAHFWKGIYNRYCAGSSALPDRYLPQAMQRLFGLRTAVIRSLFFAYEPFVNRMQQRSSLFLSSEVITKLKRSVCISAWQNRSVEVSPRQVQWTYYFRLLMNGRGKENGRFANRKQTKSTFNRLKFLDDVNANADEGQLILKIVSSSYAFIPNTVLGGRLVNVSTLLGSGLSSTCMCLSFTGTAVVGSKSDGTPMGSYCPTSIVISDVTATFAYDWWHSAFPSTPLTIHSLQTTYHH